MVVVIINVLAVKVTMGVMVAIMVIVTLIMIVVMNELTVSKGEGTETWIIKGEKC